MYNDNGGLKVRKWAWEFWWQKTLPNPKSEARNANQIPMPKIPKGKCALVCDLELGISFGFRISGFGFPGFGEAKTKSPHSWPFDASRPNP